MSRLIGLLIAAQAIFTGIIALAIYDLSSSVKESAAWVKNGEGSMGWGEEHFNILLLLGVIALIGVFLGFKKEKK